MTALEIIKSSVKNSQHSGITCNGLGHNPVPVHAEFTVESIIIDCDVGKDTIWFVFHFYINGIHQTLVALGAYQIRAHDPQPTKFCVGITIVFTGVTGIPQAIHGIIHDQAPVGEHFNKISRDIVMAYGVLWDETAIGDNASPSIFTLVCIVSGVNPGKGPGKE